MSSYLIITPARNEAKLIARTIESVIKQTVRPAQWIIVDDGSMDCTPQIVHDYCCEHPFITLVCLARDGGRHFGNKAVAFARGLAEASSIDFDFVGNLDADISLEPDYFEGILRCFENDPQLGIAGGMVYSNINGKFVSQNVALDSVAGAVQMFRRKCFEDIGGYLSMPHGGLDSAAEIFARMRGWRVCTFGDLRVLEHRWTGSATARPLKAKFNEGRRMHSLGYAPMFFFLRCLYRLLERPRVIGATAALFGYASSQLGREPFALPLDVVRHLRSEQKQKLRKIFRV
jgi:biofilm PGA synthesis N-glycosyltransferase PgaC